MTCVIGASSGVTLYWVDILGFVDGHISLNLGQYKWHQQMVVLSGCESFSRGYVLASEKTKNSSLGWLQRNRVCIGRK